MYMRNIQGTHCQYAGANHTKGGKSEKYSNRPRMVQMMRIVRSIEITIPLIQCDAVFSCYLGQENKSERLWKKTCQPYVLIVYYDLWHESETISIFRCFNVVIQKIENVASHQTLGPGSEGPGGGMTR
jgi:hypothetical protein